MSTKSHAKATASLRGERTVRGASEFDREFVVDSFKPPTATARAQWQRAKRKRGRPRQGRGVKVISVSVEKRLLQQCDALAKKMGVSRASLISRGLKKMLATASPL